MLPPQELRPDPWPGNHDPTGHKVLPPSLQKATNKKEQNSKKEKQIKLENILEKKKYNSKDKQNHSSRGEIALKGPGGLALGSRTCTA